MTEVLESDRARSVFDKLKVTVMQILNLLNELNFSGAFFETQSARKILEDEKNDFKIMSEEDMNCFFVLEQFINFFNGYIKIWDDIFKQNFSSSWNRLQDTLGTLRLIKKFSKINMEY